MRFEWVLRKLLQRYWRWQRAMTLGARGIVIDEANRVLLVRHTYKAGWILPGGGVEFGETIETSLERELEEETGVQMTARGELLGIYSNRAIFPGDHVAIYVVRSWKQVREVTPNLEIAEVGFFPIDDLPPATTDGTRRRLDEMRGRAPKQQLW